MQFCGVMVDCFNTSRHTTGWSHGPAQRNIYDENHYNQEIDTLMSFLRECKKDEKREYRIQRTQLFYTALLTATSAVSTGKDEPGLVLCHSKPRHNQTSLDCSSSKRMAYPLSRYTYSIPHSFLTYRSIHQDAERIPRVQAAGEISGRSYVKTFANMASRHVQQTIVSSCIVTNEGEKS